MLCLFDVHNFSALGTSVYTLMHVHLVVSVKIGMHDMYPSLV